MRLDRYRVPVQIHLGGGNGLRQMPCQKDSNRRRQMPGGWARSTAEQFPEQRQIARVHNPVAVEIGSVNVLISMENLPGIRGNQH